MTLAMIFVLVPSLVIAETELEGFRKAIRIQYDLKERAFAKDDPDLVVDEFYAPDVFSIDNEGNSLDAPHLLGPDCLLFW